MLCDVPVRRAVRLIDRAALRRRQLQHASSAASMDDVHRVVRLAVHEAADRLSVARAVEHLVVVRDRR